MLRPLDPGRKAYHMVGGVLCEKTVGDVLPVLAHNLTAVSGGAAGLFLASLLPHHDCFQYRVRKVHLLCRYNKSFKA